MINSTITTIEVGDVVRINTKLVRSSPLFTNTVGIEYLVLSVEVGALTNYLSLTSRFSEAGTYNDLAEMYVFFCETYNSSGDSRIGTYSVMNQILEIGEKVRRLEEEYRRSDEEVRKELRHLDASKSLLRTTEEAAAVVQEAAEATQKLAHDKIASTVTRCLSAVYDEPIEFRVVFEKKRGRTEARLIFARGGNELAPMKGSGGVMEVAALALRVACLMLARPPARKLLLLDEPFRHVQAARRPRVASLLESLASELGIQFVVISHDPEFQVGSVVEV